MQTLVTQKPDAVIQTLGMLSVVVPWLKKLGQAGIPVFSVDLPSTNVINTATSDNFSLGAQLALQPVSDIGGKGNVVVFNGFLGVVSCVRAPTKTAEITMMATKESNQSPCASKKLKARGKRLAGKVSMQLPKIDENDG
ncbi:substrate-binding domain-containing protein [Labrys sp. LIt4]|nr:substrate-binding domain-containing protein [Labrys sp. LIt4]